MSRPTSAVRSGATARGVAVTLDTGTPVDGVPEDKPEDAPLTALLMHIATFDVAASEAQNLVQVEASIRADTLVQPLIVLTPSRPESWPR